MVQTGVDGGSAGKTRVQLDLPPTTVERLNWIMDICEIGTRKDLFDNALSVLEWTVTEVSAGRKVVSMSDSDTDRVTLTMPILQTAARVAGRSRRVMGEPVPVRQRSDWLGRNAEASAEPTGMPASLAGKGIAHG